MRDLVQLGRKRPEAASSTSAAPSRVTADAPAAGAAPATRRAYVETYGCQMNVADSDMVLGLLHGAGYARTEDPADADLILINTCAVREKAEERVYARASALARHKSRAGVVLGI